MDFSYFFVTKPLQYVNATNINTNNERKLILIDHFSDAYRFYKEVEKLPFWEDVKFFTHQANAYKYLERVITSKDYLYVDSDLGPKKNYWLSKINTSNIYVYEEGVGSYRNDLLSKKEYCFFKRKLVKLMGYKEHFGGSKYVKGIYLYDHQEHLTQIQTFENERFYFSEDFITHLSNISDHIKFYDSILNPMLNKCRDKNIILYLSSWSFNSCVFDYINKFQDYFSVLKLHPHIKKKSKNRNFDLIIDNSVLAEYLIVRLLDIVNDLVIIHEGTSAIKYFSKTKITTIRI